MKYLLILSVLLFSCKKEVEVPNDTIVVTYNNTFAVSGRIVGTKSGTVPTVVAIIKDTTKLTTVTEHFTTYEINLNGEDGMSADVSISGGNGVKTYHFDSKFGNITKSFTN